MKVQLKNEYIMVRGLEDEDQMTETGIIVPKETQAENQVAQGEVLEGSGGYKKGDKILFHKIVPIDAELKVEEKIEKVWFIKSKDIVAII